MDVSYRPMEAEEAWNFIQDFHNRYHSHLKYFGYGYDRFIPDHSVMREMFDQDSLTTDQINQYRKIFMENIYNKEALQKFDNTLKDNVLPALKKVVDVLEPMANSWGVTFPDNVKVLTTYGNGGSYSWGKNSKIIFRMDRFDEKHTMSLLRHEFVHILIEDSIVQKYKVPQDLKERIVDVICLEYFGMPVQKSFENTFAKSYITKESIEKNLPGTVQKMMIDYKRLQENTHNTR